LRKSKKVCKPIISFLTPSLDCEEEIEDDCEDEIDDDCEDDYEEEGAGIGGTSPAGDGGAAEAGVDAFGGGAADNFNEPVNQEQSSSSLRIVSSVALAVASLLFL
jgi:hypothetical protein